MTGWNHRLVRMEDGGLEIHEVYYNDEGVPIARSSEFPGVFGESIEDAREYHARMATAFDKPVLDDSEIVNRGEREP